MFVLFTSPFSFLLFLYTVSRRYKRDYLHASTNIVLHYVLYYQHYEETIVLLYTTFVLTIQKRPDLNLPPPSPLEVWPLPLALVISKLPVKTVHTFSKKKLLSVRWVLANKFRLHLEFCWVSSGSKNSG